VIIPSLKIKYLTSVAAAALLLCLPSISAAQEASTTTAATTTATDPDNNYEGSPDTGYGDSTIKYNSSSESPEEEAPEGTDAATNPLESEGSQDNQTSATSDKQDAQQDYTLDSGDKPQEEDVTSPEIKAMKYSQDYARQFDDSFDVEEAMRDKTVYERSREEYDPEHIRLGSFILEPQTTVSENYSDNIFATNGNEREDTITRVKPAAVLRSDWNNHAINMGIAYDAGFYSRYNHENFIDSTYSLNGQLDVVQDTYLLAGVLVQGKHEDRSSVEDRRGSEPTTYLSSEANLEFYRKVSKVLLNMALDARRLDFSRTDATNTAGFIDNGDRDRYEYTAKTRLSYEFKPGYQAFTDIAYNVKDYVREASNPRNSTGYQISVGTSIDLSGKTKGEVYAGYLEQDYDSATFKDISGVNYGASILWNITKLTSIEFLANRSANETIFTNASGYVSSLASISVEHELRRNILLSADFMYALNDYQGIDRTDNLFAIGAGAKYYLNKNISLNLDYNFQMRDAGVSTDDFQRNRVMVSVKAEI
jgi:hypothetical protein